MAFYTICGKPDCVNFNHATYVAQYLHEHLPNFTYKKIEKSSQEWSNFVIELNKRNKWFMVNSPIIWKEISTWGGKAYLIGGLGEFWEYCYSYYGLESTISRADLQKLTCDNVKFYKEEQEKHIKEESIVNIVVSIFGAGRNPMTDLLLEEFLRIPEFHRNNGFFVKLYEGGLATAEFDKERKCLEVIVDRINEQSIFGTRKVIEILYSEEEAVTDVDLLIMLEDFSQQEDEDPDVWRKRCIKRMALLSDTINFIGKRSLRVIFANEGPLCLMATCMVEYCTIILPSNIIVLAADRGLPVINVISEMTGVPTARIGAPPVWGFLGFNKFIDEANILFKANIYRPYQRAVTAPEGSTLPLGTVVPELRLMSYLVPNQHDDIMKIVQERKAAIEARLHRKSFLPKLRALQSLLKLWYADEPTDQIISLGIISDGSNDIPAGLVFSQPCIQDKRRKWRPFPNFPLMNDATRAIVKKLICECVDNLASLYIVKQPMAYGSSSHNDLVKASKTYNESESDYSTTSYTKNDDQEKGYIGV